MDGPEIVRRLRVLQAMPAEERPISIYRLEYLAGITPNLIYKITKTGRIGVKTVARLSRALSFVENDQVVIERHRAIAGANPGGSIAAKVTIRRELKPPLVVVKRVTFNGARPRIEFIPTNPLAFPDLTQKRK